DQLSARSSEVGSQGRGSRREGGQQARIRRMRGQGFGRQARCEGVEHVHQVAGGTQGIGRQRMTSRIESSIEILERTPRVLSAWLDGTSDFWSRSNYGPDTFSPFDVVGHLIHGERTNWMVRLRTILDRGESTALPAFDRYAMYEASAGK